MQMIESFDSLPEGNQIDCVDYMESERLSDAQFFYTGRDDCIEGMYCEMPLWAELVIQKAIPEIRPRWIKPEYPKSIKGFDLDHLAWPKDKKAVIIEPPVKEHKPNTRTEEEQRDYYIKQMLRKINCNKSTVNLLLAKVGKILTTNSHPYSVHIQNRIDELMGFAEWHWDEAKRIEKELSC